MDNKSYIAHYGIPGMKWGVRRSLEELGHKLKARKTQKKRLNALKKARKARAKAKKARENFEKNKEKYMKDPVLMNKHRDMFTTDEINKANQRFTAEQNLHTATLNKLSRPKDYANTAVSYLNTGMNIYDGIQRVSKALNKDTPLPEIDKRSRKEANRILKKYENMNLSDIPAARLKQESELINLLSGIESRAYGSANNNNQKKG